MKKPTKPKPPTHTKLTASFEWAEEEEGGLRLAFHDGSVEWQVLLEAHDTDDLDYFEFQLLPAIQALRERLETEEGDDNSDDLDEPRRKSLATPRRPTGM